MRVRVCLHARTTGGAKTLREGEGLAEGGGLVDIPKSRYAGSDPNYRKGRMLPNIQPYTHSALSFPRPLPTTIR